MSNSKGHTLDRQDATADVPIRDVLTQYETALNGGDSGASLNLYADDAVLMTPNRATLIGKQAILEAYQGFAKLIAFNVSFEVQSILQMGQDWAYARTTSRGTTANRNTREITNEANQELFILKRDGSQRWQIAVYSFSSTNPLP